MQRGADPTLEQVPRNPQLSPDPFRRHSLGPVSRQVSLRQLVRGRPAEAPPPSPGPRLSTASWSAIERSVDGGRIREFTADELIAFARGFDLPLGWFLTPPPASDDIRVATPDTKTKGLDGRVVLDVVL